MGGPSEKSHGVELNKGEMTDGSKIVGFIDPPDLDLLNSRIRTINTTRTRTRQSARAVEILCRERKLNRGAEVPSANWVARGPAKGDRLDLFTIST